MRSDKVIKSSIWQLIYQLAIMLLGFLAPRYIILTYGSEINGLQSTIIQMLNVLALMNAGAITASVYELYKPFAENDRVRVSEILSNSVKFFNYVGIVFFTIMTILAFVVSNTLNYSLRKYEILLAFLILGVKNTIDLVFTSKYRTVFAADQKQHLTSIGMLIEQVIYYCLLFAIIVSKQYFLLMYASLLLGCIVKQIFFSYFYSKYYSDIRVSHRGKYKRPSSANYAMINEISHTAVTSSIAIVVSYTNGLASASIYSVYALVNTALIVFSNVLLNSFTPSFGNLIASGDTPGATRVFRSFHCLFSFMNTYLYSCSAFLIMPFVCLYTKGTTDINYNQPILGALICIYGLMYTFRIPFNILVSTNGLFKETWKQPVISAFISITLSICLSTINFSLVLIGPITFYATNFLYQYFYMKTNNIEKGIDSVLKENSISILIVFLSLILPHLLNISIISWGGWVLYAIVFSFISICTTGMIYYLVDKLNFVGSIHYLNNALIGHFRRG